MIVVGVKLSDIVPKQQTTIEAIAAAAKGKPLAVDAFNTIFQFLSIIRQPDGTPLMDSKGRVTSHISGLFYRNLNLIEAGIKLIYVFDGARPRFKAGVATERREIRAEAAEKWAAAKAAGNLEEARKFAQAASEITDDMIEESKRLLQAMGIPVVQAPSEGEAQAASIAARGDAWAVVSQDFDALLFGAPRLIRNLNITGRRKIPGKPIYREVVPELIESEKILKSLGISREQMILIGLLVGTDYNPGGVARFGAKTALKFVSEHKTLDEALKNIEWSFPVAAAELYDFFIEPPVTKKYSLKAMAPDKPALRKILVNEHDFSEERVENAFKRFEELENKKKQKTLGGW